MEVTPWAAPPPISLDLQAAQFNKQYIFLGDTHFGWRYDLNVTFYDVHPSGALKKTSWLFSLRTSNWFFFWGAGGVLWVEGESVLTDKTPNVTGAAQWSWWCWSLQSLRACYKSKSDFQCFFIFTCKIDVTQCNFSVIYVLDAEEGVSAFPLKKWTHSLQLCSQGTIKEAPSSVGTNGRGLPVTAEIPQALSHPSQLVPSTNQDAEILARRK